MFKLIRILFTHGVALAAGFALGIYLLPVLTAPPAPTDTEVSNSAQGAIFKARFTRELPGSDFLHWGEGDISITADGIAFMGSIAPGPDYQLYLTRELVLTEEDFLSLKDDSARVGPVKTFDNFILPLPAGIDPGEYKAVVVWCESFDEFITAAAYR